MIRLRRPSLQWKLTLWFSAALALMAALTFVIVFFVSHAVLQKLARNELIRIVEDNVDEVEFYTVLTDRLRDNDTDQYIRYGAGFLEIDDDFLDRVNGVYTALLLENGELLYGENPLFDAALPFEDGVCRSFFEGSQRFYVFDRALEGESLQGLWLRGMVSEAQADTPLRDTVHIIWAIMAALTIVSIVGGVLIARRALQPIRAMSVTAAQISSGSDLKKRMPVNGCDELARLAGTFNEMMQRLEQSFEAERQFASDASHELRTPLAVILAQCDEALDNDVPEAERREALIVIRRQGERMKRMLSGMLELTRLEQGTDRRMQEPFDFSELAEQLCEDMALICEKNITLRWEITPHLTLIGDKMLITRLIANLISNAYRYGRENGATRLTLLQEERTLVLSVSDNGIGIAPDQQKKIFRRLYQAAPDRAGEGAGLGLAMARQIARVHGGEISVQSTPGVGSTFTVRLPAPPSSQ